MLNCKRQSDWLDLALEYINDVGFAVVEGVLDDEVIAATRASMYSVQKKIQADIGSDKLTMSKELGVLRLMMRYDEFFFRFLNIEAVLSVVERTISDTAILHTQNGFILPSFDPNFSPSVFQNQFHRDFPRYLNNYLASINVFFAIDSFTETNGATLVVPGSHQKERRPSEDYMRKAAIPLICEAGSMIVFDSTLWHAAGINTSGRDRLAINHQFTRSFFKPQLDYAAALPHNLIQRQSAACQQLLGWYSRPPASLAEYYVPADQRLYRAGQG